MSAYEDYISGRCIEILESDEKHCTIGKEIMLLESKLMQNIPEKFAPLFLKIDYLKEKQATEDYCKLFLAGKAEK